MNGSFVRHMTREEHFAEAVRLVEAARNSAKGVSPIGNPTYPTVKEVLTLAQVHATLALFGEREEVA